MRTNRQDASTVPKRLLPPPETAETAGEPPGGHSDSSVRQSGPPADSTFWTLDDIAYHTRLSVKTLRRMLASGRFGPLPIVVGGRAQRFLREEVIEWFQAGCPRREDWELERRSYQNGAQEGQPRNRLR